ncbi:MAG: hypothetical protein RRY79_04420 [Clostridia bacterium]
METRKKETEEAGTATFICKSCAGVMRFDIEKQEFCCENCGLIQEMDGDGDVFEHDLSAIIDTVDPEWATATETKKCSSCGAEIVVEAGATTATCAFCGAPLVLLEKQMAGIKPEAIIPFRVDKVSASKLFSKWLSGKLFAPNALKNLYQSDKLQALYLPYWTFDADGAAKYTAQGGKEYYVTVGSGKDAHTERRVHWYSVGGSLSNFFDDVLISALKNSSVIQAKISQFNTKDCKPFSLEYLSGFSAKKYDKSVNDAFPEAARIMDKEFENMARDDVLRSYDQVSNIHIHSSYFNVKYKNMLLPIWTSAYMYQTKIYNFMINGQTGRVSGQYPKSGAKITATVFAGALILAAIVYFIYKYNTGGF